MSEVVEEGEAESRTPVVKIAIGVVALVVLVVLARQLGGYIPAFSDQIKELGSLGPIVFMLAYIVGVLAFLPGAILTGAGGVVFDLVQGTIYVFTAAVIGSSLAFLIARYVARDAIEAKLRDHPRFATLDAAVGEQGLKIVFLLRLSPAFPFNFMNYALGLTRISFRDYFIASIGMLPGTILYVYYGSVLGDAAALAAGAKPDNGPVFYVGLVATVAVTAIVTRLARKALAKATDATNDAEVVAADN